ncbi:hypothetical protein [Luteolibacter soli]|uniref:Uncharacterized protein n=1 Tax=Luteolibacter soli TaxID=3135280 RepID=A0ABU9AVP4_9BACT
MEARSLEHFLAGGQAVNVWAEVYSGECPAAMELAPFTSLDCDVWLGHGAFKKIHEVIAGKLIKADSPLDGQVGIVELDDEGEKVIDLLDGVFGLSHEEVKRAWQRSLVVSGIRILDPLFLFKGKCHNLVNLPQDGRQDEKHLRILLAILPAHFGSLLRNCVAGEIAERDLIREVKTFLDFGKDVFVRRAMASLGADLVAAVPFGLMAGCGLEKIERFALRQG